MDEELKGKLDRAFDEGALGELQDGVARAAAADTEAARYLERLRAIDTALARTQEVPIPTSFGAHVMSRLPSLKTKKIKTWRWHDFFLPVYLMATLVAAFLFRDALGITALLAFLESGLSAAGDAGVELAFALISSAGILLVTWMIISGFFGIRSRRTSR